MKRENERGSVLSYIVMGGVLVTLFIGGAYLVRHYTSLPTAGGTTTQQPKPSTTQSGQGQSKTEQSNEQTSEEQPSQASSSQQPSSATAQQQEAASAPQMSSTTQLPQTGPIETLGTVMMLAILGLTLAYYLRSRTALGSL